MHRIDTPGSVAGQFSDGNPAVGQQATQLLSAWFNDVQENLCQLIEEAGIPLVKGGSDQLTAAVLALIAGVVGTGGGAVPTTRLVSTSGLATGGGALAVDRTIDVAKASAAEIAAGLIDNKAITPLGLATAVAAGLADNGYYVAPGGLILQWGQLRGSYAEGAVGVTFPTSFPNACYTTFATALNQASNINNDVWCQNVSKSLSGATFFFNYDGSGSNVIQGLDYLAIGH